MKPRVIVFASLILMTGLLSAQNMFGAFQINTEPSGAAISFTDTDQYLGDTPSQVFPVLMDEYTSYNSGIPGRVINLTISKDGYIPIEEDIFVPLNKTRMQDAINHPTVLIFHLIREQASPPEYNYYPQPQPRPHVWFNFNFPSYGRHHRHHNQWDFTPPPPPPGGHHGHQDNGDHTQLPPSSPPPPPHGGYGSHGH